MAIDPQPEAALAAGGPTPDSGRAAEEAGADRGPLVDRLRRLFRNKRRGRLPRSLHPYRRLRPGGAALGRPRRPHRPEPVAHAGETPRQRRSQRSRDRRRAADRAAVVRSRRQVLPRRRQPPRPRRDGAADVRRPHLALHRRRLGADHHPPRGRPRPARRLLQGLGRRGHLPRPRHPLVAARCSCFGIALGVALGGRRPEDRTVRDRRRLDLGPDPRSSRLLHALRGAADPRRSAGARARKSSSRPRSPRGPGRCG